MIIKALKTTSKTILITGKSISNKKAADKHVVFEKRVADRKTRSMLTDPDCDETEEGQKRIEDGNLEYWSKRKVEKADKKILFQIKRLEVMSSVRRNVDKHERPRKQRQQSSSLMRRRDRKVSDEKVNAGKYWAVWKIAQEWDRNKSRKMRAAKFGAIKHMRIGPNIEKIDIKNTDILKV